MKKNMLRSFVMAATAAGVLAGCSSGTTKVPSTPTSVVTPPAVTGISTPKAVSVVTAN